MTNFKFERKCDSLDKKINAEVYKSEIRRRELYDLTEDEIKILEE